MTERSNGMINWSELRQQAHAYLWEHDQTADAFRDAIQPLFTSMWEKTKRPVARRPNISLRLVANGLPLAKLVVLPVWSPSTKTIRPERLRMELMVERQVTAKGQPAKKWTRQVTASINDIFEAGAIRPSVLEDLSRVVATMKDFNRNKQTVLARSHDWCCCCGRTLTDEVSRARGIGPECIKLIDMVLWLTDQSLVCQEV